MPLAQSLFKLQEYLTNGLTLQSAGGKFDGTIAAISQAPSRQSDGEQIIPVIRRIKAHIEFGFYSLWFYGGKVVK